MNKKLLIGAAVLGAGVVAYKLYKKSAEPTQPTTPTTPNVGAPKVALTKGQKLQNVGRGILTIAQKLAEYRASKKKPMYNANANLTPNAPKFSMTNPIYNA